jgi:hypothetical protein
VTENLAPQIGTEDARDSTSREPLQVALDSTASESTVTALSALPANDGSGQERPAALTPAQREQRALAAVKSGLYVRSENGRRVRDRKVRRLTQKMRHCMSWLAPSDDPACRAWAELEILASTVFADLVSNGHTTAAGDPRRLLSEYRGLRGLQLAYEKELGMTPAARAGLGVKVKDALGMSAAEWAESQGQME